MILLQQHRYEALVRELRGQIQAALTRDPELRDRAELIGRIDAAVAVLLGTLEIQAERGDDQID